MYTHKQSCWVLLSDQISLLTMLTSMLSCFPCLSSWDQSLWLVHVHLNLHDNIPWDTQACWRHVPLQANTKGNLVQNLERLAGFATSNYIQHIINEAKCHTFTLLQTTLLSMLWNFPSGLGLCLKNALISLTSTKCTLSKSRPENTQLHTVSGSAAGRRHNLIPKVDIAVVALEADRLCTFHAQMEVKLALWWSKKVHNWRCAGEIFLNECWSSCWHFLTLLSY